MDARGTKSSKLKTILWLVVPVALGIAAFVAAPLLKSGPQTTGVAERAVKVRDITAPKLDVVPHAIGYGTTVPARTWDAVAEVAGQVVWVSPDLQDGQLVKAGELLLRIEDADYHLALTQAEAQVRAQEIKTKSAVDALALAQKDVKLLRADYDRKSTLATRGAVSRATKEAAERALLAGQSKVADLQNTVQLVSAEYQAQLAARDLARLNLERTRKVAPFDARITTVKIGVAQYANKGQLMFSADGMAVAEVTAQFPVGSLRPLIARDDGDTAEEAGVTALHAVVRLRTASHMIVWPARVVRTSGTIDPQTQSLGVVVAVDNPAAKAVPGERPPLFRNTFVEVDLSPAPLPGQVVVPAEAVHEGMVYVVDAKSRLEKRKVRLRFTQGGYAVVADGLEPGERVVSSDLLTAVDGMLLAPQQDAKAERRLVAEATGKEPKK